MKRVNFLPERIVIERGEIHELPLVGEYLYLFTPGGIKYGWIIGHELPANFHLLKPDELAPGHPGYMVGFVKGGEMSEVDLEKFQELYESFSAIMPATEAQPVPMDLVGAFVAGISNELVA